MMPRVSVILPTYNAQAYLAAALASLQAQTLRDFEVVAVDDGSTDRSLALLQQFAASDARIRIISRANTGIVGALNEAIAAAQTPLLARMDADDIAAPERLARQLDYLETHPDTVAVGSWVNMVYADGSPIYRYRTPTDHATIVAEILKGNGGAIVHPSLMAHRSAMVGVGGYRQEALWFEDLDLYLRLSEHGQLANLPEILLQYRQHLSSVNQSEKARIQRRRKAALVNEFRLKHGLPELPAQNDSERAGVSPKADALRNWIGLARGENHRLTARRLAWRLVRLRPFDRSSWKILKLCWS